MRRAKPPATQVEAFLSRRGGLARRCRVGTGQVVPWWPDVGCEEEAGTGCGWSSIVRSTQRCRRFVLTSKSLCGSLYRLRHVLLQTWKIVLRAQHILVLNGATNESNPSDLPLSVRLLDRFWAATDAGKQMPSQIETSRYVTPSETSCCACLALCGLFRGCEALYQKYLRAGSRFREDGMRDGSN